MGILFRTPHLGSTTAFIALYQCHTYSMLQRTCSAQCTMESLEVVRCTEAALSTPNRSTVSQLRCKVTIDSDTRGMAVD
ncbi:uncharacterized protein ASPGLDRAFT_41878 [Aspergillus glaucus CBS 516.65]|uniref:Uncharacterized protein n=1 Tax=Aspergillus glaucus CBS 516.65 TaxID=1160497 RepID=A0A1L9VWP4_ASPGL|nr:hypothetical protein ASPGLDRAFT_41878 [Aspergillus glaucus CBS 516.65]OJJ88322.1 hypothetical protein ASPGLDRAFT_41878 [Aspergillus glaucus CBS 516.65]